MTVTAVVGRHCRVVCKSPPSICGPLAVRRGRTTPVPWRRRGRSIRFLGQRELSPKNGCINGQVGAVGAYFGQNVRGIVDRLLGEQLPDGGWNCEAPERSTRSSFNTTICVLEALLEYEQAGNGIPAVTEARLRGQEYLLERQLLRRRSTGQLIERDRKANGSWTRFAFPTWWHYDVLRGLEYLRSAGVTPEERMAEAIELVASKRDADGRWLLETRYAGVMPIETDEGEGRPSRWNTLHALRVLRWYESADS